METLSHVRIVVALPPPRSVAADPLGIVRALERLGEGVEIEIARDARTAVARTARAAVDLVVVDGDLGEGATRIAEALRDEGPPVVVVDREGRPASALALYRAGAAHVVGVGDDTASALPAAAERAVRRVRLLRDRGPGSEPGATTRHVLEAMNSALVVVDAEGRVVFCNPPAERILGESAAALRGRSALEWLDGAAGTESVLSQTLRHGRRFHGAESALRRGDGRVVPIGISCSPLGEGADGALGAVAIFQDLSQVHEMRHQFLQTEKMASIGQLAAGVAHEINNPMGFIHANLFQMTEYLSDLRSVWAQVDALRKAVDGDDPGAVRRAARDLAQGAQDADVEFLLSDFHKAIRESQEGAERIRHIVQDLRDFSHRDRGERVLADLNQCLDSTANIVWPMMKHAVRLEKDYGDLPLVPCFPMELKQVFMNLLVNAYQAIQERVGDSGELRELRLATSTRDDCAVVAVSDTGVGIPPESMDRIFDPFFTTKKVGEGTGLGLSTSFHIVRRHGGTLSAESQPGRGTTFEVVLPLALPEEDAGASG